MLCWLKTCTPRLRMSYKDCRVTEHSVMMLATDTASPFAIHVNMYNHTWIYLLD